MLKLSWPIVLVAAVTMAVLLTACAPAAPQVELTLNFTGLEQLGTGWIYEGWFLVDGTPVSTGVFTVDANGVPSATNFTVPVSDPNKVTSFVLTIEPSPDPDPAPSAVHVLAGDFVNNTATLSVTHPAALGYDFSDATGSYVLAVPSAGEGGDYKTGIWWLDPEAGPGPTLVLPSLPAGWVYEGWVAGMEGPVSTGRFAAASGADSDGAGPTAGPNQAPPFPGQDFVMPPVDLTAGYAAVVSIEPEPDDSPGPFAFKPLVDMSIEDLGALVLQAMENHASGLPTGTATIAY